MSIAGKLHTVISNILSALELKADITYVDQQILEHAGVMLPADILAAIKTVDGTGSGLDADLLGGISSSGYSLSGHNHPNASQSSPGFMSDVDKTKLDGVASGANNYTHPSTHSADIIVDGTTNKAYTETEKTKLAGIESGATADMTASEILTAIKTVDGASSGLDADTLDGYHETDFPRLVARGSTSVSYSGFTGTEYYEKYSDGKLIKYGTLSIASLAITTSRGSGAYYTTSDLSFTWNTNNPAFTTLPLVEISAKNNTYFTWSMKNVASLTSVSWNLAAVFSVSARAFEISYHAVGRWN